jgi:hypothetical protein
MRPRRSRTKRPETAFGEDKDCKGPVETPGLLIGRASHERPIVITAAPQAFEFRIPLTVAIGGSGNLLLMLRFSGCDPKRHGPRHRAAIELMIGYRTLTSARYFTK